MEKLNAGGLCNISGIYAAGVNIGFKQEDKDFALIYVPDGGTVSGMFTKNNIKGAPVLVSQEQLNKRSHYKAIAINTGNANACTGQQGIEAVHSVQAEIAEQLKIDAEEVLIASTGIIGQYMDLSFFSEGVEKAIQHLSNETSSDAAEAILTTDTKKKELAYAFDIGGKRGQIASITKGSGMIHPNLGTMISIIVTDVAFKQQELHQALKEAVDYSFNHMTIDGDTSTNDTVLLLSTGQVAVNQTEENKRAFTENLTKLCQENAQLIAADGEGSHKFVTVNVEGAVTVEDALKVAKSVATSSRVKTAVFGESPNWGRIMAAVGYAETDSLNPETIDISISNPSTPPLIICQNSSPLAFNRKEATEILAEDNIILDIHLHLGRYQASVWTCDLSNDYVKINANYL